MSYDSERARVRLLAMDKLKTQWETKKPRRNRRPWTVLDSKKEIEAYVDGWFDALAEKRLIGAISELPDTEPPRGWQERVWNTLQIKQKKDGE